MKKAEKIDLKDSNIANYGSKEHKDLRKTAADAEPEWKTAGKAVGLEIWRIEKLAVKKWDKKLYGQFYSGDCYIILNTYKVQNALRFNLHFWLGRDCSQDEQGVAAYKTVELDDHLGDLPVQYREVQGYESKEFLNLFPSIHYLDGGIETGFHHVKPSEYKTRLYHIKGRTESSVIVKQVPLDIKSMNEGDVFVMDAGLKIWQWQGKQAGVYEKRKAADFCRALNEERLGKCKVVVLDSGDADAEFWKPLGGKGTVGPAIPDTEEKKRASEEKEFKKTLFRLSDSSGKLEFKQVAQGTITRGDFKSDDVFILDTHACVFVFVGKNSSKDERANAMKRAIEYITTHKRPAWIPITRVCEGSENEAFLRQLDSKAAATAAH